MSFKDFIFNLLRRSKAWDGLDLRQTLRTRCDFDIDVSLPDIRYVARVLDASPRGLRMRIRGPWNAGLLKKGQTAHLKYLTPMYEAELDTIQAQVRWAKREGEQIFLVAMTFDDTVENLQKSWVKPVLLKGLRKKVAQSRRSLRVRCNLPAKLTVNGQLLEGCLIDLSIDGARIESFKQIVEESPLVLEAGPAGQLPPLKLNGTVKRVLRPYGTFTYGVKLHPDETDSKVLLSYIKHFHEANKKNTL